MDSTDSLTISEARKYYAKLVGLSKPCDASVFYRLIYAGRLRAERGPGVRTRVSIADLESLAKEVGPIQPKPRCESEANAKAKRLADFQAWVADNA